MDQPLTVERRSLIALLLRPAKAPLPPLISSTAAATPQLGVSYLANSDHWRQDWLSAAFTPAQLVPDGPGPALTLSRPTLYVAPSVRPLKLTLGALARADAALKPSVRHFLAHLHRAAHHLSSGASA